MPNKDLHHDIVVRALIKAGWTIVAEQYYLLIGEAADQRRLYIDIKALHRTQRISVLIEVKNLEKSPVHDLMMMIGQYLVYRAALDLLQDNTPLYVAVSQYTYYNVVLHPLGKKSLERITIPFMIYDAETEEILKWIPQL